MEQKKNNFTIEETHKKLDDILGSLSSSSTSSSISGVSSGSSSLESDSFEEVTSPVFSSSSSLEADPLSDMSSLFEQLPIKRGLSRFYEGKSQSFTSLKSVRSLEDLAKGEKPPYSKRLKSCRSYGGSMSKRGWCSSLSARRGTSNFIASRPPIPPHRSTTTTLPNQTVLFA